MFSEPPVYFETCLDLAIDYGFAETEILDGNHVMVCPQFSAFLWHMLGQQICLRTESGALFRSGVHGVVFEETIDLDNSFVNPLGREFPAGYTCLVSPDVICIADWGAAFLSSESGEAFLQKTRPTVRQEWD